MLLDSVTVAARSSPLSRAQVHEVWLALREIHPGIEFSPHFTQSRGDLNRTQSLRNLPKNDFFTREIDQLVLQGKARIAIHSAKDLPEPLDEGLHIVALTRGIDSSDSLVLAKPLGPGCVIATSSHRREEAVLQVEPQATFVDIRGTIEERLAKLGEIDGVVIAEAALVRLKLTHLERIRLPGDTVPLQGRLAVVARKDDLKMANLFSHIHYEKSALFGA